MKSSNQQNTPLISCVIATYNRAEIIPDAINSILNQTYNNWELVVIDDQSTDNTWNVVNQFATVDDRIHCHRNPSKGANNARNLGIEISKGDYIAFLDDDDTSYPHRFKNQIEAMLKSGYRFIVSWYDTRVRDTGRILGVDKKVHTSSQVGFPSRWMIEKSLIDEVGGFNPSMVAMQDIEISTRLAKIYTYAHHRNVVTTIYDSPNSTSSGITALQGKIQLLKKAGHLMLPEERSDWHLNIALGLYMTHQNRECMKHLKEAIKADNRLLYKYVRVYLKLTFKTKSHIIKKFNCNIIRHINERTFPKLVNHPSV